LTSCKPFSFSRRNLHHGVSKQNLIPDNREIQQIEQEKAYKYLGIRDSESVHHQQLKASFKNESTGRLRMILNSELYVKEKITAVGALAITVLRYSFEIISRRVEEIT
jgi:uncharacterized protein with von Willebrand factor type A (vWA) domain